MNCIRIDTGEKIETAEEFVRESFMGNAIDVELLEKLVDEGQRAGRTPWCACGVHENYAYNILNRYYGDYPQETMEETCKRRVMVDEKI